MVISSPVAGLRPCRSCVAGRRRASTCTIPPIFTFSALPICSITTSSSAVIAFFASARESPAFSATASASWVCVSAIQPPPGQFRAKSKQMGRTAGAVNRRFSRVAGVFPGRLPEMTDPELARLRAEIAAIDREVLDALNRRLALVRRVSEHKADTGAPAIDATREAELLTELAAVNAGPLSEQGVRTAFSALLDVMKTELRRETRPIGTRPVETRPGDSHRVVSSVAVIGTGLLGTSVARAAKRSGVARIVGWDEDGARLRESG